MAADIEQLTDLVQQLTAEVRTLQAELRDLRAEETPMPTPPGASPDEIARLQFAHSAARYNEAMANSAVREQNQFVLQQMQGTGDN